MNTIAEYFPRIEYNSRPSEVAYKDWADYTKIDFAWTFLPHINSFHSEYLNCYDGAELFDRMESNKHLKHIRNATSIVINIFTLPSTSIAGTKKSLLRPEKNDICLFMEIDQRNDILISFKFGTDIHKNLRTYIKKFATETDSKTFEQKSFKTTKQEILTLLNRTANYDALLDFICDKTGIKDITTKAFSFNIADKRLNDAVASSVEGVLFEAGSMKHENPNSWGHGDIEKAALSPNGFSDVEIDKVYFGNWLRDFSSFITGFSTGFRFEDRETMRKLEPFRSNQVIKYLLPTMPIKPTHDAWVKIIQMIAVHEFVISGKKNPSQNYTQHEKEFKSKFGIISKDILGIYRPEEHIDNPKGTFDESILAHKKLKDRIFFNYESSKHSHQERSLYPGPFDSKKNGNVITSYDVNPSTKMKRYIKEDLPDRDSAFSYFKQQLQLAVEYGKSNTGFLHLGSALHVLEDYYAHTNFLEISLIKKGYINIEPWVELTPDELNITDGKELACKIPVVTGVFGLTDLVASVTPKLAEILLPVENADFKDLQPGDRTFFDILLRSVLEDYINQNKSMTKELKQYLPTFMQGIDIESALELYDYFLGLRDTYLLIREKAWFITMPLDKLNEMLDNLVDLITFYPKYLLRFLMKSVDEIIKFGQSTNMSFGTDPTHTQIAKDSPDHPLNPIAGKLAVAAVGEIGRQVKECWEKKRKIKTVIEWAEQRYFVHPCETDWMDERIEEWAKKNPEALQNSYKNNFPVEIKEFVEKTLDFVIESLPEIKFK